MKRTTQLLCLPFAGGNKYSYREYVEKAPSFLKLTTLEYAGRGSRMREPLVTDIDVFVDDLYRQVVPLINDQPYAIYGHSLGGLMTYLLTLKLLDNNHQPPIHLFITGTTGPGAISRTEKKRHLLEKKEFIEEVRALDGMPEEILTSDELLEYFEPILRADFQVSETYIYEDRPPLDIPITVITGTEEDMELPDIQLWQNETTHAVDFKRMPGKHFFIFQHAFKIIEIISKKLYLHKTAF